MKNHRDYLRFLICGIALSAIVAMSVGCSPEPKVEIHRVPKQHILDARHGIERARPPLELPTAHPPTSQRPETMFAAMVPHGESTWFFKIKGARELVVPRESDFRSLVESIHFDAENEPPQWQMPEGWRREAGSGIRLATLFYGTGEQQIELSIIPLGRGAGDYQAYILDNVNRWRDQVRLPPVDQEGLSSTTERIALSDGLEATLAVLHSPNPAPPPPAQWSSAPEITCDIPDGWTSQEVPTGGVARAAFSVSQEDRSVEITVTALPARVGTLLPNVNRWRGQLGFDPIDADELAGSIDQLEVGSITAHYLQITGENDEGNPDTIFVVTFDEAGHAWFIKLRGDPELARQEQENFEAFARSFRVGEVGE